MSQMTDSSDPDRTAGRQQPALTFPTANDLPADTRTSVIPELNRSLADTTDLSSQMKVAHWNVKGMDFYQLHLLFDEVAEVLEDHADTLAERVTALGSQAKGSVRMAAANSRIPEIDPNTVTGQEYLQATTDHLRIHATNLRADIDYTARCGDEGTADLYTELSREVDKQLYFLESHLQTQPAGTVADGKTAGTGTRQAGAQLSDSQQAGTQQSGTHQQGARGHRQPQRVTFGGPTP